MFTHLCLSIGTPAARWGSSVCSLHTRAHSLSLSLSLSLCVCLSLSLSVSLSLSLSLTHTHTHTHVLHARRTHAQVHTRTRTLHVQQSHTKEKQRPDDLMFQQLTHIHITKHEHTNEHTHDMLINMHTNIKVLVPSELQPGQKWKVVSGGCAEVRHALFDTL